MKRKIALAFLLFVLTLVGATLALLRTRWAGDRLCELAEAQVRTATGLPLSLRACAIDPFSLELSAEQVRLGAVETPLLTADRVSVQLEPIQALGKRLHFAHIGLVRPKVQLVLPPSSSGEPAACPPPFLSQFDLKSLDVEEGSLDLTLSGGERVKVSRVGIRSSPSSLKRTLRDLASSTSMSHLVLTLGPTKISTKEREIEVQGGTSEVDFASDLSLLEIAGLDLQIEGAALHVNGRITDLCSPVLALEVQVAAPMPALLALAGQRATPSAGEARVVARIDGPYKKASAKGKVELSRAKIDLYEPGNLSADFRLSDSELVVERADIQFRGGKTTAKAHIGLRRGLPLSVDADLNQVELGEIFSRLGLQGAYVMTRINGHAKVTGSASPLALTGRADLDIKDFRVLTHSWEHYSAGESTVLSLADARVEGPVRIDGEAVRLDNVRVVSGQESLAVTGALHFDDTKGFSLAFRGGVDIGKLGHLGEIPWSGRAQVDGSVGAPNYGEPRIDGRAQVSGFRFLQLDLGEVAAAVTYDRLILDVKGVEGLKGETRYGGSIRLDFKPKVISFAESRLTAKGRLSDLFDVVLPWQPGARTLKDLVDARVEASASASGPVSGFDVKFDAQLGEGTLAKRAFQSGAVQGRVVQARTAVFEQAEIRRGSGRLRATGSIDLASPSPCELKLSAEGVALADLELPGGPWAGTMSGGATVTGSIEVPAIQFAGDTKGLAVRDIPVGAVKAKGNLSGKQLVVTGTTEGVRFSGSAQTTDGFPFQATAELKLDDVTRFFPGGPPAGLTAEVEGKATAEGRLSEIENAAGRIEFVLLRGGYADFRVGNEEPMVMTFDHGRVVFESFKLVGVDTQFSLSGERAASGKLDLDVEGSLDLRLLGGLTPAVASPRGQLKVEAHVAGTAVDPVLVGSGSISDAGFRVHDLPIVFSRMNGDLLFSQNRILFSDLSALLNGGRTDLTGEVELSRFVPVRLKVNANADEVRWTIPEWLPATLTGQLTAFGSPDALTLKGQLRVVRADYTERVDIEKSIIEFWRKRTAAARAYDKSGQWLRFDIGLTADGDVRVNNDLARGGLTGDVTLTGTLAAPGLIGSLSMTPGSRAFYRGNEFDLANAVIDFTDRHRLNPKFDVHGEAAVRDYEVFLHVFGTLDAPEIQLTSNPALAREDIATLLSLGYTTRDTLSQSGLGVAARAAAAQALFSVSGLDDQVKRYLPKEGVLRDFSVRMTTAYSEGTGQVEPRAELESKILGDRLKLRYQAPLSDARGQRAQAELKLGERSWLQYQWDNENPDAGVGDHGIDLKFRWEWND